MSGDRTPASGSGAIDAQVLKIGAELASRVEQLSSDVVAAIRAEVDFYRDTDVIDDEGLLTSTVDTFRVLFAALKGAEPFDTSPAEAKGFTRAVEGAPLPAVMAAFRVASHHIWDAMIELSNWRASEISREALIRLTARLWQAQDAYTDAMAVAYRRQAVQQLLDAEIERAALVEALLNGRLLDDRSIWEIAELLRLPQRGPYVVVAAEAPVIGRHALAGVAEMLRSVEVSSAWRLLPDAQIGIAHVGSEAAYQALLGLLRRVAVTAVGVSPRFDDLPETAQALRYARIAQLARRAPGDNVTVFDASVLGVAAVGAPDVTTKLADIVLGPFDDLPVNDRAVLFDTFRTWIDEDGSVARTAAALFCHPNTVRHRLHRIEERSGRSLNKPRELAELCLAMETQQRLP